MKVVALVSGGKDSCYAMQLCQYYGHEIVALANLFPLDDAVDELDSFMYQTVGHQLVGAFANCMGVPLFRKRIQGKPRRIELCYTVTEGDEVEDLEILLREVKSHFPDIGGVSSGAIASDYQRLRVESVCVRVGLVSLAFLWKQQQASLLQQMVKKDLWGGFLKIDSKLHAVIVKVAAMGLDPYKHLGENLETLQPLLTRLQDLYGCNICGEGGEYESLTLDCLLFKNAKIVLDEFTIALHSPDKIAPVGVLHPIKFHLEPKLRSSADVPIVEVGSSPKCGQFSPDAIDGETDNMGTRSKVSGGVIEDKIDIRSQFRTKVTKQQHGIITLSCQRITETHIRSDVMGELAIVLESLQESLKGESLSWADVLYVHLFLGDMAWFVKANEVYMQYITVYNCLRGVPSRCTVEVPLHELQMGSVAVEILAARDQSKKVLHVQSISCWAPSSIGPYSQATLHRQFLYMAGQLGLDPPTMLLVPGGAGCQMGQALKNCQSVAEIFTSSFIKSVLSFTIYCSSSAGHKGNQDIAISLKNFFSLTQDVGTQNDSCPIAPLTLYVLLPALPKGALVEVVPLTYVPDSSEIDASEEEKFKNLYYVAIKSTTMEGELRAECYNSGKLARLASLPVAADARAQTQQLCCSPCQGLILPGRFCRAMMFVSSAESVSHRDSQSPVHGSKLNAVISGCMQALSDLLKQAFLSWADVLVVRIYFIVGKIAPPDLDKAVKEFFNKHYLNINQVPLVGCFFPEPILIPVIAVGGNARMQDLISLELLASNKKS